MTISGSSVSKNVKRPNQETHCPDNNNITIRKKAPSSTNDTFPLDNTNESSLLGDTMYQNSPDTSIIKNTEITLGTLTQMINAQLKDNNKTIIAELQSTIQTEINKAIVILKEETKKEINNLTTENSKRKTEISQINLNIGQLTEENKTLKQEIKQLQTKLETMKLSEPESTMNDNDTKIVIYGVDEIYRETENVTHDLTLQICQELLNINLQGYVENIYRIGRKGHKRPILVELASKKITQRILNLSRNLQHSHISITEHLDENAIKMRNILIEDLKEARKAGKYAVIRNNKLIIKEQRYHNTKDEQRNKKEYYGKHRYQNEYRNYQQRSSQFNQQHIAGQYNIEEELQYGKQSTVPPFYSNLYNGHFKQQVRSEQLIPSQDNEQQINLQHHKQQQPQIQNYLNTITRKSYAKATEDTIRNQKHQTYQRSHTHFQPTNDKPRQKNSQNVFLGY